MGGARNDARKWAPRSPTASGVSNTSRSALLGRPRTPLLTTPRKRNSRQTLHTICGATLLPPEGRLGGCRARPASWMEVVPPRTCHDREGRNPSPPGRSGLARESSNPQCTAAAPAKISVRKLGAPIQRVPIRSAGQALAPQITRNGADGTKFRPNRSLERPLLDDTSLDPRSGLRAALERPPPRSASNKRAQTSHGLPSRHDPNRPGVSFTMLTSVQRTQATTAREKAAAKRTLRGTISADGRKRTRLGQLRERGRARGPTTDATESRTGVWGAWNLKRLRPWEALPARERVESDTVHGQRRRKADGRSPAQERSTQAQNTTRAVARNTGRVRIIPRSITSCLCDQIGPAPLACLSLAPPGRRSRATRRPERIPERAVLER